MPVIDARLVMELRITLRGLVYSLESGRQWCEPAACVEPWLTSAHLMLEKLEETT
jgi:hypothetical protein